MARISTHVLDTAKGRPAPGIGIQLRFGGEPISFTTTNSDGRTDAPLLTGDAIPIGEYEIVFHVNDYFRQPGVPFLSDIAIRFGVSDPLGHYHVPLLVSPHGYTTYRGS